MDQDQTAPFGAVWSGFIVFASKLHLHVPLLIWKPDLGLQYFLATLFVLEYQPIRERGARGPKLSNLEIERNRTFFFGTAMYCSLSIQLFLTKNKMGNGISLPPPTAEKNPNLKKKEKKKRIAIQYQKLKNHLVWLKNIWWRRFIRVMWYIVKYYVNND